MVGVCGRVFLHLGCAAWVSAFSLSASAGVQEQVSYDGALLGDPLEAEDVAGSVDLSMGDAIARVLFPHADPAGGEPDEGGVRGLTADEAARQSSNPLGGDFMVWINEWDLNFNEGDITTKTRNSYTHLFQMVVPIPMKFIGDDWILVNRPTLPIVYDTEVPNGLNAGFPPGGTPPQPPPGASGIPPGAIDWINRGGIADLVSFHLLGVSKHQEYDNFFGEGDLVIAGGLTTQWPTGTSGFTSDVYALGPAAVAAWIGEKFIFGGLPQFWTKVGEGGQNSAPDDFNFLSIQMFYFLNFPGGWQVGGTPIIAADFEAKSGDKWTVPIGLGVFKTQLFDLGSAKMPIKFGWEIDYVIRRPDTFGPNWIMKISITPITPNFIAMALGLSEGPGGKK